MIMKSFARILLLASIQIGSSTNMIHAANIIPADNPNIQYFGRWDFTHPLAPSHSWPGVYVYAEFEGTSIGIRLNDNFCYWNVIDKSQYCFLSGSEWKYFGGGFASENQIVDKPTGVEAP